MQMRLLQGGPAGAAMWSFRRPRWLVVERVYLLCMWRSSQKAHRWWATTRCQSVSLDMLAPEAKARHARSARLCVRVGLVLG